MKNEEIAGDLNIDLPPDHYQTNGIILNLILSEYSGYPFNSFFKVSSSRYVLAIVRIIKKLIGIILQTEPIIKGNPNDRITEPR